MPAARRRAAPPIGRKPARDAALAVAVGAAIGAAAAGTTKVGAALQPAVGAERVVLHGVPVRACQVVVPPVVAVVALVWRREVGGREHWRRLRLPRALRVRAAAREARSDLAARRAWRRALVVPALALAGGAERDAAVVAAEAHHGRAAGARLACVNGGVDVRVEEDDAEALPLLHGLGVIVAVGPLRGHDAVDVHGLHRGAVLLQHHLAGSHVALAVVAHEDVAELGVERAVLLEVLELLVRERQHVVHEHELRAGAQAAAEHVRGAVEAMVLHELLDALVELALREVLVDVRPRREEAEVARPVIVPLLGAVEAEIELLEELEHAGVELVARQALVHAGGVLAAGAHERVVHVAQDLAPRAPPAAHALARVEPLMRGLHERLLLEVEQDVFAHALVANVGEEQPMQRVVAAAVVEPRLEQAEVVAARLQEDVPHPPLRLLVRREPHGLQRVQDDDARLDAQLREPLLHEQLDELRAAVRVGLRRERRHGVARRRRRRGGGGPAAARAAVVLHLVEEPPDLAAGNERVELHAVGIAEGVDDVALALPDGGRPDVVVDGARHEPVDDVQGLLDLVHVQLQHLAVTVGREARAAHGHALRAEQRAPVQLPPLEEDEEGRREHERVAHDGVVVPDGHEAVRREEEHRRDGAAQESVRAQLVLLRAVDEAALVEHDDGQRQRGHEAQRHDRRRLDGRQEAQQRQDQHHQQPQPQQDVFLHRGEVLVGRRLRPPCLDASAMSRGLSLDAFAGE
mmetsp:Transcript_12799/g.38410  ORF Transcript_12799/g.38410 Transcript_12799/m.38410 type:complete len:749 (-) Transcript_12799:292-2538(-)